MVKRIYRDFMRGKTPWMIATELKEDNILTPSGKSTNWRAGTINSILSNEKYKGSALLQKTFTVDYLTKKMKTNEGEVPQYFVEKSHEAIIPPCEWEQVQKEMLRRKNLGRRYRGGSIFSTKIICEDCGSYYGSKVWHSTSEKYRQIIWQCNDKFKNNIKCQTPHISEEYLKEKFVEAFNIFFTQKNEIIENYKTISKMYSDCTSIDSELKTLNQELSIITEMTHKCVQDNATIPQNQKDYLERYNRLVDKYEITASNIADLETKRALRKGRATSFKNFIQMFNKISKALIDFDEDVWLNSIDTVKVKKDGHLVFVFHGGTEVEV